MTVSRRVTRTDGTVASCRLRPVRLPSQGIETRRLLARGIAQQWFGGLMRPATAADGWLLEGLAGWAEDQYLRTFMGANELAYRSVAETS